MNETVRSIASLLAMAAVFGICGWATIVDDSMTPAAAIATSLAALTSLGLSSRASAASDKE